MSIAKDLPTLERVVFASSYLIYDPVLYRFPRPQESPIRLSETSVIAPRNLTGSAKLSHEIELEFLNKFKGSSFSYLSTRIFRGYGRGSRDVISRWIRSLLNGDEIYVYGQESIFDYIYATDSARGIFCLMSRLDLQGIINLGTGYGRRVQDVLNVLQTHFPTMQVKNEASDDLYESSVADLSLIRSKIAWEPKYTLENAIPEIIDYERDRAKTNETIQIPRLLVTSASRKIPLLKAARKALSKIHPESQVIAGDLDSTALSAQIGIDFMPMPPTDENNLNELLAACKSKSISVVLPTRDGELVFWGENIEFFEKNGISVIISSPESLRRCLDKLEFFRFGNENSIPVICTSEYIDQIDAQKLVVKERYGSGATAVGVFFDRDEARAYLGKLDQPIVQPFIEGIEISIDAWIDRNSVVKGVILRRRDLVKDGESQVTTTFSNPALAKHVEEILSKLNLCGPIVMQGIIDHENNFSVIEVNPRFGGASTVSLEMGLDSLYWSVLESLGEDVSRYPFVRPKNRIKQVRAPTDHYLPVDDCYI